MKKNRRKKNKGSQRSSQANENATVMNFREHLKSQDPETRDAALQHLRQADVVSVIDSKGPRAILIVADKLDDHGDGMITIIAEVKKVQIQVDDEQIDEPVDESHQQIEELRKLVEEAKGPWKFIDYLHDPGEEPRFMFSHNGAPHFTVWGDMCGLPFARTREGAKQFVAAVKKDFGVKLAIADMQAVTRKSFEEVLAKSFLHGANCYFVVIPIDHRGKGRLKVVLLENVLHVVDGWIVRSADTELPKYKFTHAGQIVFNDDGDQRGPILAYTREVAERYAAEVEKGRGIKLSVSDIREDTDMTDAEVLNAMVAAQGSNSAMVIRSVADDGETKSDFIYPVNAPAE